MAKKWQDLKKVGHKEKEIQRRERERLENEALKKAERLKKTIIAICITIAVVIVVVFFILFSNKRDKHAKEAFRQDQMEMKVLVATGSVQYKEKGAYMPLKKGMILSGENTYRVKTGKKGSVVISLPDGGGKVGFFEESQVGLGSVEMKRGGDKETIENYQFEFISGDMGFKGVGKYPVIWQANLWKVRVKKGECRIILDRKRKYTIVSKSGHTIFSPAKKKISEEVIWQNNRLIFDRKGRHGPITQPKLKAYRWFR